MNKRVFLGILLLACQCGKSPRTIHQIRASFPEKMNLTVYNPLDQSRIDAPVLFELEKLKTKCPKFNEKAFVVVADGKEIPSQKIDQNGDGTFDAIFAIADFKPKESKPFTLYFSEAGEVGREYPRRTQAEISHKVGGKFKNHKYYGGQFHNVQFLRVPPEHTDHSEFIRYEGPGWESDKIGYRLYLDWRNAIDIFGKKVPDLVLHKVGLDGFESYHHMADWGMDILKVGDALGIGAIGWWDGEKVHRVSKTDSVTCAILSSGPIFSKIQLQYYGWSIPKEKINLTSALSIWAGSRMTHHEIWVSKDFASLCTGLVKHDSAKAFYSQNPRGDWAYLALYGRQSLSGDHLGMAIVYPVKHFVQLAEDPVNHVVVLKSANGYLDYYFLAAWEQEPGGIRTEKEFLKYVEEVINYLDIPLWIAY